MIVGTLERPFDKHENRFGFWPTLLKDVDFEKVMTLEEMHMTVARFVGGVVTQPQKTQEPPNDVRIMKHGFDKTTSFRTRKST